MLGLSYKYWKELHYTFVLDFACQFRLQRLALSPTAFSSCLEAFLNELCLSDLLLFYNVQRYQPRLKSSIYATPPGLCPISNRGSDVIWSKMAWRTIICQPIRKPSCLTISKCKVELENFLLSDQPFRWTVKSSVKRYQSLLHIRGKRPLAWQIKVILQDEYITTTTQVTGHPSDTIDLPVTTSSLQSWLPQRLCSRPQDIQRLLSLLHPSIANRPLAHPNMTFRRRWTIISTMEKNQHRLTSVNQKHMCDLNSHWP